MDTIYIKSYKEQEYSYKDILRYAKVDTPTSEIDNLITECINELKGKLSYRVCYKEFPITLHEKSVDLGFALTASNNLRKNLDGCSSIILFAATIGLEIDRIIKRYSVTSPAKAVILQAIGTERIESLCNTFDNDIATEKKILGHITKPRFSPGYGDLPLELQTDIFETLEVSKHIGISLGDNLFMTPTKSVTAIIGVA